MRLHPPHTHVYLPLHAYTHTYTPHRRRHTHTHTHAQVYLPPDTHTHTYTTHKRDTLTACLILREDCGGKQQLPGNIDHFPHQPFLHDPPPHTRTHAHLHIRTHTHTRLASPHLGPSCSCWVRKAEHNIKDKLGLTCTQADGALKERCVAAEVNHDL